MMLRAARAACPVARVSSNVRPQISCRVLMDDTPARISTLLPNNIAMPDALALQPDQECTWFLSLPRNTRATVLGLVSHGLTIGSRVLCHRRVQAADALELVRQLNERHHQVAGYLLHIHAGNENQEWAPIVIRSLLNPVPEGVCTQASEAWSYARSHIESANAA